jgi:uncharacterized protein
MVKMAAPRRLDRVKKAEILGKLREILGNRPEISFVYLHGSFTGEEAFRDIDIALYLNELPESPLDYELSLETALMEGLRCGEIDVRILNKAPLSFKYHAIKERGVLLSRDEVKRTLFVEETLEAYLDFAYHRQAYLKEALGA